MNTEPQLLFDETEHKYTLHRAGFADIILPSVTQIMEPLEQKVYGGVLGEYLDNAADRGTRLHRAVEQYLKYGFHNVDDDCVGYFDGFVKFTENNKSWKPIHSEYRFYHPALLYAGTCDLLFQTPVGIILVDLKTTAQPHLKMWAVQLGAYKQGIEASNKGIKIIGTKVLQVSQTGNYRLYGIGSDFNTFLACYTIFNFHEE